MHSIGAMFVPWDDGRDWVVGLVIARCPFLSPRGIGAD